MLNSNLKNSGGRRENILAINIGVLFSFVLILVSELYVRVFVLENFGSTHFTEELYDVGNKYGWTHFPNTASRFVKVRGEQVLYDALYKTDYAGRRIVAAERVDKKNYRSFVAFFGGSQVFGDGLSTHETLPSLYQEIDPDRRAYNYGVNGYGPAQVLLQLSEPDFAKKIPETNGTAIYSYFGFHILRVVGSTSILRWDAESFPYFELDENGAPVFRGSFRDQRPFWTGLYHLANRFTLLRALGIEFPIIRPSHHELFCALIEASRDRFLAKYPAGRFLVAVNPLTSEEDPIISTCLEPRGIRFVDLRKVFGDVDLHQGFRRGIAEEATPYRIPGDGHFTSLANRRLAEALKQFLDTERYP